MNKESENYFCRITTFSKYLAFSLFIILPFLGGYVGYTIASNKAIDTENITQPKPVSDNELNKIIPGLQVELCDTKDVLVCFGSGLQAIPNLNTKTYTIYALVSKDAKWSYGLIHKQTGDLYFLSLE